MIYIDRKCSLWLDWHSLFVKWKRKTPKIILTTITYCSSFVFGLWHPSLILDLLFWNDLLVFLSRKRLEKSGAVVLCFIKNLLWVIGPPCSEYYTTLVHKLDTSSGETFENKSRYKYVSLYIPEAALLLYICKYQIKRLIYKFLALSVSSGSHNIRIYFLCTGDQHYVPYTLLLIS